MNFYMLFFVKVYVIVVYGMYTCANLSQLVKLVGIFAIIVNILSPLLNNICDLNLSW